MSVTLDQFLHDSPPLTEASVEWQFQGQTLPLSMGTHLAGSLPPFDHLITSVRAIVVTLDSMLVVRDPEGCHLLPGGRREQGESCIDCVRREVLEETGCEIDVSQPIGFMHYRHLGSKPRNYPYPYPDFLQVVFAAQLVRRNIVARVVDEWVRESFFTPYGQLDELEIPHRERMLLVFARQIAGTLGDD